MLIADIGPHYVIKKLQLTPTCKLSWVHGNDSFMYVPIGDRDKLSLLISKEKKFADQKL